MIRYVDHTEGVLPRHLEGFFADWPNPPSPDTHLRLLEKSDEIVLAIDEAPRQVVGFITAITDGVLSAYIPFLEVRPAAQGRGIGRELTRRMLARLAGFYMIDLVCDADLQSFYADFGMRPTAAMSIRDHEHQAGRQRADIHRGEQEFPGCIEGASSGEVPLAS